MNRRTTLTSSIAALLIASAAGMAFASEGGHGHSGGHPSSTEGPAESYAQAVDAIAAKAAQIGAMIESGKLSDVHHEAEALVELAGPLARLATRSDSGVERSQLKAVNLTAKRIVTAAGELHEVADDGDAERSKALFEGLNGEVANLRGLSGGSSDEAHESQHGENSGVDHSAHGGHNPEHNRH